MPELGFLRVMPLPVTVNLASLPIIYTAPRHTHRASFSMAPPLAGLDAKRMSLQSSPVMRPEATSGA